MLFIPLDFFPPRSSFFDRITTLLAESTLAKTNLETLTSEIGSLRMARTSLTSNVADLESTLSTQTAELASTASQLTELETQALPALRKQVEEAREAKETVLRNGEVLEGEVERLKEEVARLEGEASTRSRQVTALADQQREEAEVTRVEEKEEEKEKKKARGEVEEEATTRAQLELSAARSQIRELEGTLFEAQRAQGLAEAKILKLERQHQTVHQQQQYQQPSSKIRSTSPSSSTPLFSPPLLSSSASTPPGSLLNPFESLHASRPIDADLSASSKHARNVSLSMLKARMAPSPSSSSLGGGSLAGLRGGIGMGTSSSVPNGLGTSSNLSGTTTTAGGSGGPRRIGGNNNNNYHSSSYSKPTHLGSLGEEETEPEPSSSTPSPSTLSSFVDPPLHATSPFQLLPPPQFSDREGIIWCKCCEGDLIVI